MPALVTRSLRTLGAVLATSALLVACESGGGASTVTAAPDDGLLFEPPAPILATRAIVRENLSLDVRVDGDGIDEPLAVNVLPRDDGRFGGTLRLPPGQSYTITLTWSESVDGTLLRLAVATSEFTVVAGEPNTVEIRSDQYDSSVFDDDEDGSPNLDERRNDTLPLDDGSPGTPVVTVPLTAMIRLPGALAEAGDELVRAFDARATLGGRSLPLSREGDVWTGVADVVQDTSPVLDVTLFADAEATLALAVAQRSVEASGNAPSVTVEGDDYEIRDSDGDSLSNLDELIGGTNPRDSSDPPPDPCDVSAFEPGCRIDTDGDGRFDSQETADADRDGDGRPDYQESSQVDLDEDGRFADNDRDEGNACIPSTDNDACRSTLDSDGDGVPDARDNCRSDRNPEQEDVDDDGAGDACDTVDDRDGDGDGTLDEEDNCPLDANPGQEDIDDDGLGDECDDSDDTDTDGDRVIDRLDNCPTRPNTNQADVDNDDIGDACDPMDDRDDDGDTVPNVTDNCPDDANRDQADSDGDGRGDRCDTSDARDPDGDDLIGDADNCPTVRNPDQADLDGDDLGDVCDADDDGDGVDDVVDNCSIVPNADQANIDGDAFGDACDDDDDGDGVDDALDNCPLVPNAGQANADGDAVGDACDETPDPVVPVVPVVPDTVADPDDDDLVEDEDNCPAIPNPDQEDFDDDEIGDACDDDDDNDGVPDEEDVCPLAFDPEQRDSDEDDAVGDACDGDTST